MEHELYFSIQLGIIIPTDELIFFRGVGIPPTSIYIYMLAILNWGFIFGLLGAGSQLECDCNMGMLFPAPAKGSFHRAAANHPHRYPLHHNDDNNNKNDNNDDDNTIYMYT